MASLKQAVHSQLSAVSKAGKSGVRRSGVRALGGGLQAVAVLPANQQVPRFARNDKRGKKSFAKKRG